ncbi:hypothetical protein D3C76_1666820 [compost metagenome]
MLGKARQILAVGTGRNQRAMGDQRVTKLAFAAATIPEVHISDLFTLQHAECEQRHHQRVWATSAVGIALAQMHQGTILGAGFGALWRNH